MHIWAGHLLPTYKLENILSDLMKEPFFPVPYDVFQAQLTFHDFEAGREIKLTPEITIQTAFLNHPNNATGYRVNYKGRSVCYVTDTEHKKGILDQNIIDLIKGSDVFIYDSTYSDEEYEKKKGWGHSTWQEGIRLAKEANVKKYYIFHHDPSHKDEHMDDIAKKAKKLWEKKKVDVAKEGLVVDIK